MDSLKTSWQRAWRGLGAQGDGVALFETLCASYSEPWRKYHTLQHLCECVRRFNGALHLAEQAAEVEAALWFHDALYDVRSNDNELRSAQWARSALLQAAVQPEMTEQVAQLVLATQHNAEPRGADEQLLIDIDLSILGAGAERFNEYEAQVREEYAHVPDVIFNSRRTEVLLAFLGRGRIFSTDHFYSRLEANARANLRRSIELLGA